MTPTDKRALKALCGKRAKPELRRLFKLIRSHDDRALYAAIAPPRKRAKTSGDPLLREVEQSLRPILATAAEKADLLVEHLAKKHGRKLDIEAKGLADAVRRLRPVFSDAQIRAGVKTLLVEMAALYSTRETVV